MLSLFNKDTVKVVMMVMMMMMTTTMMMMTTTTTTTMMIMGRGGLGYVLCLATGRSQVRIYLKPLRGDLGQVAHP